MICVLKSCPIIKKNVIIRFPCIENGTLVYEVDANAFNLAKFNVMLKSVGVVIGGKQYHGKAKLRTVAKKRLHTIKMIPLVMVIVYCIVEVKGDNEVGVLFIVTPKPLYAKFKVTSIAKHKKQAFRGFPQVSIL